eukprot:GFUD01031294.1.p1 GENE.GFUD01031294.1~~GFUD01031294.1.p1  ORF type:complete len:765 (+),score=231.03 GFUD01031294.1:287-2296(+)
MIQQQPPQSPQQLQMIQQQQLAAQQQQQAAAAAAAQQQRQQQLMAIQQQRAAMTNITNSPGHPHPQMMPGTPGAMPVARFAPRVAGMPGLRPQVPGIQQQRMQQFVGHAMETRLPPDLCLLGCIFVIVDYHDMEEAKHLPEWKKVITQYGGEIEESLSARVTHVLANNQKSAIAQQARAEGKRLVSAYWLNDTVVRKKVLPPWKAIHFPLPANFEPPCTNMILTLTGFEDRDRDYVKDMIKIAGATYTGYFTKHNHAIICKRPVGEKFEKAREWRVPAVSIQWLNDVLFGSANAAQSMNNPRYQQFKPDEPLRIDYSLVPHLIQAWKNPIRVTPETYQKFKANPPARIKRKAERQRQEREAEERKRKENEERRQQGLPPLENDPSQSNIDPATGLPIAGPPEATGLPGLPTGAEKPAGAPDVVGALPESDAKMEVDPPTGIVKEEKMDVDEESAENKENENPKPQILFSGMESNTRKQLMEIVTRLGAVYTDNPKECTHLVMVKLSRTNNMLMCLPGVKYILGTQWVVESGEAGRWISEEEHMLNDPEVERKFNFNLAKTLARANRDKLFMGKIFYLTPSVQPSMQVLTNIITYSGGRVENRRRKTTDQMKEINSGGNVNYIIITCEEDIHLVTDVLRAKLGVFNAEFVLSAVTRCEMDFDLSRYLTTQ